MNKIAVFDIDGTVYREVMSFIVAEELLARYDFPDESKALDEARHIYKSRATTEAYWTYNKTILDLFKKLLRQTAPAQLDEVIAALLTNKKDYCYAYTTQLIQQYKAEGRTLIAISGSIGNIIEPFARGLGFDYVVASDLEVVDGVFTGNRVTETKHGKDQILRDLVSKHGLSLAGSIGVGDTHRDLSMLHVTEHPIAFNPNAALFEAAQHNGWNIVIERKNMVYELKRVADGYQLSNARPLYDDNHQEQVR